MPSDPIKQQERHVRSDSPDDALVGTDDACRCVIECARTRKRSFAVAPADGGGWGAWTASFRRLLDSLVAGPAHCLVVTQEPNERYVQLIVGHDHVRIEVSSNYYLADDHRLASSHEDRLVRLGFRSHQENDPDEDRTKNWWIQSRSAHPGWIAELVAVCLVEVAAFEPGWPVNISMFGCDHPCRTCAWGEQTN